MSTSKKVRNNKTGEIKINGFKPIVTRNYAQGAYLDSLRRNQITFAVGPAGTGKSYIATAYAAEQLYYKKVDKIIITRPAVEAEESLGFLPGELIDGKFAPYMAPVREILDKLLGKTFVEYCLKVGDIEPVPLAYMRGRTFDNSIVLLTEAQNTTPTQMKLILSRIGENTKYIVEGDISQKDISVVSGMEDAIERFKHLDDIEIIRFLNQDIVRSKLCKQIIQAYSDG